MIQSAGGSTSSSSSSSLHRDIRSVHSDNAETSASIKRLQTEVQILREDFTNNISSTSSSADFDSAEHFNPVSNDIDFKKNDQLFLSKDRETEKHYGKQKLKTKQNF